MFAVLTDLQVNLWLSHAARMCSLFKHVGMVLTKVTISQIVTGTSKRLCLHSVITKDQQIRLCKEKLDFTHPFEPDRNHL